MGEAGFLEAGLRRRKEKQDELVRPVDTRQRMLAFENSKNPEEEESGDDLWGEAPEAR